MFGGVLFWLVTAMAFLIISNFIYNERVISAGVTLAIVVSGIAAFCKIPSFEIIKQHPIYILYGFLAYLVIAVLWAVFMWRHIYLPTIFEKYDEVRAKFLAYKGITVLPEKNANIIQELRTYEKSLGSDISRTRMAGNNKARITIWMIYWPFSMVSTFFGEFLQRVFSNIYKYIANSLQKMSDKMASNYSELK